MATLSKTIESTGEAIRSPHKSGRQVSASQAKTHLLELLKDIGENRQPLVITKRGRPIAQLTPIDVSPASALFGCMKGTGRILGDVVGPEPEEWEAMAE